LQKILLLLFGKKLSLEKKIFMAAKIVEGLLLFYKNFPLGYLNECQCTMAYNKWLMDENE